jgi:hypothetical protein
MAHVIGNVTCGLRVHLRMKTPALGARLRVASWLCSLAAFALGGKLTVELDPEMTSRTADERGVIISEQTTPL